jgi:hypothetical protein
VPPDLTSLFDVLFIVIFAALIRAAAVQAAAQPKPPAPPVALDRSVLRARALAEVDATRKTVVVRVSAKGTIAMIEVDGTSQAIDAPLLELSADPDVAISYLGDRAAELRVCKITALHLGVPDLSHYLVIVAPAQRLADLPHALFEGLHRDLDRCLVEERGIAVLVDPTAAP